MDRCRFLPLFHVRRAWNAAPQVPPFADRIIFAIAANVSIASLNLSLMINSVGFYQIAKLLIIPFTAVVQSLWLKESLTWQQAMCTTVVLMGVAIVYVPPRLSKPKNCYHPVVLTCP